MKLSDFDFQLPEQLIAQKATEKRDSARLFFFNKKSKEKKHLNVSDLPDLIDKNYCLVFNKSRTIPARILFDGKEIFLSRPVSTSLLLGGIEGGLKDFTKRPHLASTTRGGIFWETLIRPGRKFPVGASFKIGQMEVKVEEVLDSGLRVLGFSGADFYPWLLEFGQVPLPPYIKESSDFSRYQTTFSKEGNSVATPTAGLHFTPELLDKLKSKGVQIEFVHLDVGLGTFLPVKSERVEEHKMHSEFFSVDSTTAKSLNKAKKKGKKILAVGSTSVRTLETLASKFGEIREFSGETDIFITPGYEFQFVDEIFTNFHLPKSTLLMLMAAYIGKEEILNLYKEAVEKEYRFFSFGDAMYLRV